MGNVRETLCELEIPYIVRNVGKSPGKMIDWLPPRLRLRVKRDYVPHTENRRKLQERGGRMQVPYLVDPNTNVAIYKSAEIQRYLRNTYGASSSCMRPSKNSSSSAKTRCGTTRGSATS
jgi:hypothetical protein